MACCWYVAGREALKRLGGVGASVAKMHPDDFPCVPVKRKPNPLFVIAFYDKRPHLVALEGKAEQGLGYITLTSSGIELYCSFT